MKKLAVAALSLLLASVANAQGEEQLYFRLDANVNTDDPRILNFGGWGIQNNLAGSIDLSFLRSDDGGDTFGVDLGGGYTFNALADFVIGAGALFGYNSDDSDFVATWYPQLAAVARFGQSFGVSLTYKYYWKLYGDSQDIVMLGLLYRPAN